MPEGWERAKELGIQHYYHARPCIGQGCNENEWLYYRFCFFSKKVEILENDVWIPLPA
jgi:hypothetical protein